MQELIESIRAAVADGATAEQKMTGAQACRAILAALDAEAGKPLALLGAPTPGPFAGLPPDQMLDLLIARLSALAEQQGASTAPQAKGPPLRIAYVQPPGRRRR